MPKNRKQLFDSKFEPLHFGTSGIRAFIKDMTDMECYINTRGFIKYLYKINEIQTGGKIALGGDLRSSSTRIMSAVYKAILDENCQVLYCGFVPTPTLSYYAWQRKIPAVMVTGSHIPDDQNGIKFIKSHSEVLKEDEKDILDDIAQVRKEQYLKDESDSYFDINGNLKEAIPLPQISEEQRALAEFQIRYTSFFPNNILAGKKIVLYEQSAVGRDLLKNTLILLGAEVISVDRSEKFIPIDTEKIPDFLIDLLKQWAKKYNPFAIVSTDGDSDRPILTDENGCFLSGDLLGALVSLYVKPEFVAIPVSSNDAIVTSLKKQKIETVLTKVGSPYCISAMNKKLQENPSARVVSWERNGGYLLGSNWNLDNKTLKPLPTRDSFLPILISLIYATEEKVSISALIEKELPHRFIISSAIDNKTKGCESYDSSLGEKIMSFFSPKDSGLKEIDFKSSNPKEENWQIKLKMELYFNSDFDYTPVVSVNYIDGIRICFLNNDVVHLRPSSNSPEFRLYATADTKDRANKIIADRLVIMPKIIFDISQNYFK